MSSLKTVPQPLLHFRAFCLDCKKFHDAEVECGTPMIREMESWQYKHAGHEVEFNSRYRKVPRDIDDSLFEAKGEAPWWLNPHFHGFTENTNFQFSFNASINLTYTSLNSLATDANLLAGASSLVVDNGPTAANLEIGIKALVKNNGSSNPTAGKEIDLYTYDAIDDIPTYPDTIAGTDALKTITTANILTSGFRLMASLFVAATQNQVNPMASVALSQLYGVMPRYWGVFVVHNSGQALNASGNQCTYKGVYVAG
jgi:hypothetical protein